MRFTKSFTLSFTNYVLITFILSLCVSEATISRIVREIRQEVEVDEMCAKVVQEVKVIPEVKDKLDVKGTVEVRNVEGRHSSAGDRWSKVSLVYYSQ